MTHFQSIARKVSALTAATVISPLLANAQSTVSSTAVPRPVSVPDGGPGIVLLAIAIGLLLLFARRQSSHAKAGSQR
jgi:hypothetical protein